MIGKIIKISNKEVTIKLSINIDAQSNFLGVHVIFEDSEKKIVGEIVYLDKEIAKINIVGEFNNDKFIPGVLSKPSFRSTCRIINMTELEAILGKQALNKGDIPFASSTVYKNYRINISVNKFFSNHFALLGNTGSGKSCAFARIMQNVFSNKDNIPIKAKFLIFDAYGEYVRAFSNLSAVSPEIYTKVLTTNIKDERFDILKIPLWLLDTDDIALLLEADRPEQLPIIREALKLVPIFKGEGENVKALRNDIIARALLDILRSGKEVSIIRDQVTAVLSTFNTVELNLESQIHQPGYVRTLKQCLLIDKTGKMPEMELVVTFLTSFTNDALEIPDPDGTVMYNLKDLKQALDFALISEGILKSESVYNYANVLSVRLQSLINSDSATYFDLNEYYTKEEYISSLFLTRENNLAQILNININYVDDRMAKVIVKIISRMIFLVLASSPVRGANPIHIIIEEAHRYVQEDLDLKLLGYNIFDRITKEGRKYGAILGLITQRPSELTDTSVSQCTNFVILRTLHPEDLNYISKMVPNISEEGEEAVKSLQSGTALVFGSAFPLSLTVKFDMPNPEPLSSNADISSVWYL